MKSRVFLTLIFGFSLVNSAAIPKPDSITQEEIKKDSDSEVLALELTNIQLSPKLDVLYARLNSIEPDKMKSGLDKFRQLLNEASSSEDFLNKLSNSSRIDPTQVKKYLAELIQHLEIENPKVLSWLLSTVYGDNHSVSTAQVMFLEQFSKYDEEMASFAVWNRYWTYLFKIIGEYIANYG